MKDYNFGYTDEELEEAVRSATGRGIFAGILITLLGLGAIAGAIYLTGAISLQPL